MTKSVQVTLSDEEIVTLAIALQERADRLQEDSPGVQDEKGLALEIREKLLTATETKTNIHIVEDRFSFER